LPSGDRARDPDLGSLSNFSPAAIEAAAHVDIQGQVMSRRKWILLCSLVALAAGLEIVVLFTQSARTRVRIINAGATKIEDLLVSYAGSKIRVGDIAPGETGYAHLSGNEKGTLELAFTQAGNPMSGFQVADYDPSTLRASSLEQVLEIKVDQVARYMEDAGATTPLSRLRDRIANWMSAELDSSRL